MALDQDYYLMEFASVHTCREWSLKCVDTLLVCGLCLSFLLLLLLGSGLRCLLLGCFVDSSLLCSRVVKKLERLEMAWLRVLHGPVFGWASPIQRRYRLFPLSMLLDTTS